MGGTNWWRWRSAQQWDLQLAVTCNHERLDNEEVSKMPSKLEIIFGVLRSYFKYELGREGTPAATKHFLHERPCKQDKVIEGCCEAQDLEGKKALSTSNTS